MGWGTPSNKVVPETVAETGPPPPSSSQQVIPPSRRHSLRVENLPVGDAICIFMACSLPTIAAVACFSLMGTGLGVYNAVAAGKTEMMGNACGCVFLLWLCTLFIFDAHKAYPLIKAILYVLLLALLIGAGLLKGVSYPWAVVLFVLAMSPVALATLRKTISLNVSRDQFYRMVGMSSGACALILLMAWLIWTFTSGYTSEGAAWDPVVKSKLISDSGDVYANVYSSRPLVYASDCGPSNTVDPDSSGAADISTACAKAETVWFVIWMTPFAAVLFNIVVAAFCILESRFSYTQGKDVTGLLQQFVCILVFLIMGMYCSIYASGVSVRLASAFMAFFAGSVLSLMVYVHHEIRPEVLARAAEESTVAKYMFKAWKSDWIRALGVFLLHVLIPGMLLLDVLRQKVRRCKDSSTPPGTFTESGQRFADQLNTWNWNSILVKVHIIGELCFVLNLGGKLTFVLFSWLGELLEGTSLAVVLVLVYFVGCGMFLLPPVPGSAVYMFAGIVIGKQAQSSVGFWPGVVIASFLGLVAKLCACVGQYGIGYFAGKSVSVQKTIGVDKVPTRAIEKILNRRGMNIGKVAILVGGPDWPTSVTCGILNLNIPQMLLGTLPVFIASIAPQTLVGALLTKSSDDGSATLWSAIKTASTGLAAVCQAAASLIAAYTITQTIEADYDELAKERPEHAQVAELTAKQAEFVKASQEVSAWESMLFRRKVVIIASASLQLLTFFIFATDFVLMEPMCFRKFTVQDKIGASFADGGLNGNVLELVRRPVGAGNLVLFAIAVLLHIFHSKDMKRAARKLLNEQ